MSAAWIKLNVFDKCKMFPTHSCYRILDGLSENRKIVTRAKSQRSNPTLCNFLHIVLEPKYTFGTKKANTGTPPKAEFLILYFARSIHPIKWPPVTAVHLNPQWFGQAMVGQEGIVQELKKQELQWDSWTSSSIFWLILVSLRQLVKLILNQTVTTIILNVYWLRCFVCLYVMWQMGF